MSNDVTLTKTEATAVLLLLKSITYEGIVGEAGLHFQATLMNLGERIDITYPESEDEQYELWERLGKPGWANTKPDAEVPAVG